MPAGSWLPAGGDPAEEEIAQAVGSLLQRAHQGPGKQGRPGRKPAARDRRVAARTMATAQPAWPRPEPPAAPSGRGPAAAPAGPADQPADKLAGVVPLAVFDAREEARRWW